VDTGGTFTDVVAGDGRIVKVLSTPDRPDAAVADGVAALGDGEAESLAHGTTVATNALLERRGATIALVTNRGFADVIEIGRQDRPSLYDPWADRPEPVVARHLRYEVSPEDVSSLAPVDAGVESIAVCLLHADLDARDEQAVRDELVRRGHEDVTCSHEVSPEFREYERTLTTAVNAYLRPACRGYLRNLAGLAPVVSVMTSAGGLLPLDTASELPVALLLSGPAAGARAAAAVASACGHPDAITFDMGGTSTDVCLVRDGVPEPAPGRMVGGFSIRLPSLDVHTIGAGGGSIARIDSGGALVVGPESAGARPGPACYGLGGTAPTVTDANLLAGRIPAGRALPGLGALDVDAARAALGRVGVDAADVLTVVNAAMEQALRAVSVERGVDPVELALVAFGGAGPLHACDLADALGMTTVIVPARAGVLSAVGLVTAPARRDLVRTWPTPDEHHGVPAAAAALAEEVRALVGLDAAVTTAVDCRYAGQSHELSVPDVPSFHAEHERRNGYSRPGAAVEVVAVRATALGVAPPPLPDAGASDRAAVRGPAVVAEDDCTIWVADGWSGEPGPGGALILRRADR
jgi:N-methylhydantoinase A/oxoprolinase/acetone carboxylase beta subunit